MVLVPGEKVWAKVVVQMHVLDPSPCRICETRLRQSLQPWAAGLFKVPANSHTATASSDGASDAVHGVRVDDTMMVCGRPERMAKVVSLGVDAILAEEENPQHRLTASGQAYNAPMQQEDHWLIAHASESYHRDAKAVSP